MADNPSNIRSLDAKRRAAKLHARPATVQELTDRVDTQWEIIVEQLEELNTSLGTVQLALAAILQRLQQP